MAAPIPPSDLPIWVPGQVLLDSDGLDWNGVSLRAYRYLPSDVEVPPMRDYMLVYYRRGPTLMNRRVDGSWRKEHMVPGNVSLLTRAEQSHWRWTSPIDVVHLYLTADVMARVSAESFDRDITDVRLRDILKTDDGYLAQGIAAIAEEVRSGNFGGRLFVDAATTMICVQILRRFAEVSFRETGATAGLSPLQAKLVADFVEANLESHILLSDLAQVARLSTSHFLRQFKRRFGCAPHQYLLQRRVACAQRLLARTQLPIKGIAAKSGFADQAHMTRVFQQLLGTTPHGYRTSCQS